MSARKNEKKVTIKNFKVLGHDVNVSKIIPFSVGDWLKIEKLNAGIDSEQSKSANNMLYFLNKGDAKITLDEVHLISSAMFEKITEYLKEINSITEQSVDMDFLE